MPFGGCAGAGARSPMRVQAVRAIARDVLLIAIVAAIDGEVAAIIWPGALEAR
jgi:hypothetical protein